MRTRTSFFNRTPKALLVLLLGLGAALGISVLPAVSGCGGDDPVIRRGEQGANCVATNDCMPPLSCIQNVCGGPQADAGDAGVDADLPQPDGAPFSECDNCLDKKCEAELSACDAECIALEACIEMTCKNLSTVNPNEESKCFVQCQTQHSSAKDKHLAVVDCAVNAVCKPPCLDYPVDYDQCRAFMNQNFCAGLITACDTSPECQTYRDCIGSCSTLNDCNLCDNTAEGIKGKQMLFDYEQCVAAECISESWLVPTF